MIYRGRKKTRNNFWVAAWLEWGFEFPGSHGMIPIRPNLFSCEGICHVATLHQDAGWCLVKCVKTTYCENSIPQRVSGAFLCFFVGICVLCENKRHFFVQEWKDKNAKCRRGEWCFPNKNLPQTDPYQVIWEVLSRLGILKKRNRYFWALKAGSVADMRPASIMIWSVFK